MCSSVSGKKKKKKVGKKTNRKKFSSNLSQTEITDRQNEWQPPRGTIFPVGYYLKRKHDNIHAKEIGDKICIQIWSLGFHSLIVTLSCLQLYCVNVSAAVLLMSDRMLLLGQSSLTNGVSCVTM